MAQAPAQQDTHKQQASIPQTANVSAASLTQSPRVQVCQLLQGKAAKQHAQSVPLQQPPTHPPAVKLDCVKAVPSNVTSTTSQGQIRAGRFCCSPSFVMNRRPDVATSRRPTVNRRGGSCPCNTCGTSAVTWPAVQLCSHSIGRPLEGMKAGKCGALQEAAVVGHLHAGACDAMLPRQHMSSSQPILLAAHLVPLLPAVQPRLQEVDCPAPWLL